MTRTIYALLVGIDDYPSPVTPLKGCVNDIERMKTLLGERIVSAEDEFRPLSLTNGAATRQGIIDAFRNHLGQAGKDDVVLFCYSGHGSQQKTPPEFWNLEPDRRDETLVCYDSRSTGGWDLADKEISQLIAEVAVNDPHITIILDCCHSGSGTRDALDDPQTDVGVRRVESDDRIRPIETFIVTPEQVNELNASGTRSVLNGGDWVDLPQGRHVLLAACRADETAKEIILGGERRGVFSYYLQDTLQRAGETLSYRDLFKNTNALVRKKVSRQAPVLEATDTSDIDQLFLGGVMAPTASNFTLSFDRDRGWVIDGGAVHGIPAPSGSETTILALFPFDNSLAGLNSLRTSIGEAKVLQVFPAQSTVQVILPDGVVPDKETTYKAVAVSQPLPPLTVAFEGNEEALELVRNALNTQGSDGGPSLLVKESEMGEADYRLQATIGQGLEKEEAYRIRRMADAYPLAVDTLDFTIASAAIVVDRLEHIARWERIADLRNNTTEIPESAVNIEVFRVDDGDELTPMDATEGLYFEYNRVNGEWKHQSFQIKLTNKSDRKFYCMLLDLTEDYSVYTSLLLGDGQWLEPGEEAWAHIPHKGSWRKTIDAFVSNKLHAQGVTESRDILKLIVSTEECDAKLMYQAPLPVGVVPKGERSLPPAMNTLNRIMYRVGSRSFGDASESNEAFVDWRTTEINSTIYRPLDAVTVPEPGETAELVTGVVLAGHPSLSAKARVMPLGKVGRDVGNLLTPGVFRDHPDVIQPFEFTSSRSGSPGLSVLELFDVADPSVVTAKEPLVVQIDEALAEDEIILPYAYDGEFFLPLGYVNSNTEETTITLERLPDVQTPPGLPHDIERALLGSIKIMFQKMVGQHIGLAFPYPVLAVADVANDGTVTYQAAGAKVLERVEAAENILLYIHGMFGDSRGMAGSAQAAGISDAAPALVDEYDLILTFDYESINTEVEDTARELKQRLDAVGLGPNHGKHLDIISHSLGGLVARWFIEREGGNEVVNHLVTVGTPHLGTPWPTIQAWATTALTLALNGFSTVAWPVKALSALLKATELIDVTVDAVAQDSKFLVNLNASLDPGTYYTLLAGNTSLIPEVVQPAGNADAGKLERLLATLQTKKLLHKATGLAFFNQANDIAVSVDSAYGVPAERVPKPVTPDEVACDHVSYFGTGVALASIADALD